MLRQLLAGLPALVVGGLVAFMAIAIWTAPENELLADYVHQAGQRFGEKDYKAASVCYERLVNLRPKSMEYRFALARCMSELNRDGRAVAVIGRLAPLDGPGYAPAQLWAARRLMLSSRPSDQALAEAELRLLHALQAEPNSAEANALLGQLYITSGRLAQAEEHLGRAAGARPDLYILLAAACKAEGKADGVHNAADQARAIFALRLKNDPASVNDRVNVALSDVFLNDYEGAVEILKEGIEGSKKLKLEPNPDPLFKNTLAKVYIAWADALAADADAPAAARLKVLEDGLVYDPVSVELLDRLIQVIHQGGAEGQRAHEALGALAKSERIPANIHFALGVDAWERKDAALARDHWEEAYKLMPTHASAANNLAWLLSHEPPLDLPRALGLIDKAVQEHPRQLRFRGTRGQILALMDRWPEALTDLEAALKVTPESVELHQALAEVYDHLGDPEIASEHRRYLAARADKASAP